jgi:hypothetical protein
VILWTCWKLGRSPTEQSELRMDAQLWKFSLPPSLLQRGFWLYVWKIRGPKDEALCYVGMTGDVTGVAQSPFVRASNHLGQNKNNNALRRRLSERGVNPERCTELSFSAYGPIYDSTDAKNFHENRRKVGKHPVETTGGLRQRVLLRSASSSRAEAGQGSGWCDRRYGRARRRARLAGPHR